MDGVRSKLATIHHRRNATQQAAIAEITTRLLDLPDEKLAVVYDFIAFLAERETKWMRMREPSGAYQTMLASEDVLSRDWDRPEEDEAWADL